VGSQGADILIGGDGNDVIQGKQGNDVAQMGAGDDTFQWNPGDASDTVEGQDDFDTLLFNGSNIAETVDIFANGSRAVLHRDVANVTMDLNGVERIDFNALAGADHVNVGDMTGTGVTQVNVGLAGALGSSVGDGEADTVAVAGTNGVDQVVIATSGTTATVSGLAATTTLFGLDASDQITVNGLADNDTIDGHAAAISLVLNGGAGADTLIGGTKADVVNGGSGNDVALLGDGGDTFVWNPGDGSDTVDGQSGFDTLQFNGANIAETIDISANGDHVRFTRDVAAITMDLDGTEKIAFKALGGADTINVHNISGTDAKEVAVDLGQADGSGDGQLDTVVIDATDGDDLISFSTDNGVITVHGLGADVTIKGFEADDRIVINGLGGDDVIDGSGLSGMLLTAHGGQGDDILFGSLGNDILTGDEGDDILFGNGGLDVLDGGPGSNILFPSLIAQAEHFM
jgi:Ca2+-binding RTX toxin-like protein